MVNERESLVGVDTPKKPFCVIRDRLGRCHIKDFGEMDFSEMGASEMDFSEMGAIEMGAMRLGRLGRIGRIGMCDSNWAARMNTISNSIPDFASKSIPIDYD
jgi:hypothetical protein